MNREQSSQKVAKGLYRHYKGGQYEVLETAIHSETLEELVFYRTLQPNDLGEFWVRPKEMFLGTVTVSGKELPRFEWIADGPS